MTGFYGEALAHIHDEGYTRLAGKAAEVLLAELRDAGVERGTVVELGCGSGAGVEILARAGHDVTGYDLSDAMLAIARERVPAARFVHASFLDAELPNCDAVCAIGEVLGYAADERNGTAALRDLFVRVHAALREGGVFLFDLAGPGRVPVGEVRRHSAEGEGWAYTSSSRVEPDTNVLVRDIELVRGGAREREVHRLLLQDPESVVHDLEAAGFQVETRAAYGDLELPPGLTAFVARLRSIV
ncbi:MAG: class I SAM-dependent methyltransferase [Planctomycetota bacterium]